MIKSKSKYLVDQFQVPHADFNQQVSLTLNSIRAFCAEEQSAEDAMLLRGHWKENMGLADLATFQQAVTAKEFSNGQRRKSTAGNVYQQILQVCLSQQGIDVTRPSKTAFGSSVDLVTTGDDGNPSAFLAIKHTLRERYRGEKIYAPLGYSYNAPMFIVTNDNPSQTALREILGLGFDVVLRSELISQYTAHPHLHAMSDLPALLHRLARRFRHAA